MNIRNAKVERISDGLGEMVWENIASVLNGFKLDYSAVHTMYTERGEFSYVKIYARRNSRIKNIETLNKKLQLKLGPSLIGFKKCYSINDVYLLIIKDANCTDSWKRIR